MNDITILAVVGVVCVAAMECIALSQGIDGALFGIAISAITSLISSVATWLYIKKRGR